MAQKDGIAVILGKIATFIFAETAGPALNNIGTAIGERLARLVDPEGAQQKVMAMQIAAVQSGLAEVLDPEEDASDDE